MMLVALATGVGLRHKIREKVSAFNGHIQIFNYDTNFSQVSVIPVSKKQEFYPNFNLCGRQAVLGASFSKNFCV